MREGNAIVDIVDVALASSQNARHPRLDFRPEDAGYAHEKGEERGNEVQTKAKDNDSDEFPQPVPRDSLQARVRVELEPEAVMALDITESSIGICISGHPQSSRNGFEMRRLDPIQLRHSSTSHGEVADRIDVIAREHDVCAVVVGWPLQPEGNPGKPCGRVLHTLKSLVEPSGKGVSVVSKRMPFTLWDDRHAVERTSSSANRAEPRQAIENDQPPDQWGRCVAFARAPNVREGETYCSRMAYESRGMAEDDRSEKVLRHFLRSLYEEREPSPTLSSEVGCRKVTDEHWEEEESSLL
eukprot:CAMPEP_0113591626 /NCGR_PEP_ID=MMETSP0015_2-20120614/37374_1 /TAXON_ID=2838 /ORGANISM="Odontella" /LENGTH=297 /DNA_ID=CAMNT_0000498029 /DNA_START=197 /DNA_END=1092 /DNA_ORIENTATION=- /assembly_acc=CAM_ASM_000160